MVLLELDELEWTEKASPDAEDISTGISISFGGTLSSPIKLSALARSFAIMASTNGSRVPVLFLFLVVALAEAVLDFPGGGKERGSPKEFSA